MEKLSTRKRLTIIRHYLAGLSYDEIAAKCQVSKGTVANIVADLKAGRFPEATDTAEHLEQLRELSLDLKRSNLAPAQCAVGLAVVTRINECGLEPGDIDRWSWILRSAGSEEEAQQLVRTIYSIQGVQQRTGLSLDELDNKAQELEKQAGELEPTVKEREKCQKQVTELTKQRNDLTREVANLEEKYQLLNPRVKDLDKHEQKLSGRIKDLESRADKAEAVLTTLKTETRNLHGIGLSPEALVEFSQRLKPIAKRHQITSEKLRDRLLRELESLDQGMSLETLIKSKKLELEEQKQAIILAKQEQESLKATIDSLKLEKKKLEASIKAIRENVEREIAKIIPAAKSTVNTLVKEFRSGHDEALGEVRRLKGQAIEIGQEIGRYREIVETNQWLSELQALAVGDERLDAKQVRVITLLVLRGTAAWLNHYEINRLTASTMSFTLSSLIKEVEKWQV